jgi:hypothetical protein
MSTATVSHHRVSDPLALAAAVAVIIGGATVIGVAAFQHDTTTPAAPAAPVHGKITVNHPARVGLGDFRQSRQSHQGARTTSPTGGHPMVSES